MADAFRVPEPLSSDTDDVTDALDVAQSLWENGKRADAIHWVKRAAESARSDPSRMALLARAAEDLERATAPRSMTPPPVPVSKPPPPPTVSRPPPPPVPKISKPPPVPPPRTSVPPPAALASAPPPAPPPAARPSRAPQLLPQRESEDRVRVPPASSDQTLRVRATMRVSVKTSVRDASLLVVRPLADGAAVPAGTREALLTFVNDEDTSDLEASS